MAKKSTKKAKKEDFISVRVTEQVKQQLLVIAEKHDRSLSYVVNQIIIEHLNNNAAKKHKKH